MKGCIIGGVVLAVVIAAVVGNAVFVRSTVNDLIAKLDTLPEIPDPATTPAEVASLREKLQSNEALLGLSVNIAVLDKAVESLRGLEANARAGDVYQYRATLEILREMIENIGRLERVEVKNLL